MGFYNFTANKKITIDYEKRHTFQWMVQTSIEAIAKIMVIHVNKNLCPDEAKWVIESSHLN